MTSLELLTRENKLLREERERMINSLEHLRTDLDLVRRENTLLRGEREMNNKDIEGFIKPLKPYIYKLLAIKIPQQKNAYHSQDIMEKSKALGINSQVTESLEKALKNISEEQPSLPKRVLITGSLYLVGYFLEKNK